MVIASSRSQALASTVSAGGGRARVDGHGEAGLTGLRARDLAARTAGGRRWPNRRRGRCRPAGTWPAGSPYLG